MNQFPATEEQAVLNQSPVTAHLQFRNAALEAENVGRDYYKAGMLYLYAAWCADDSNAQLQAHAYRNSALQSMKQALNDGSCPLNERATVEYVIGELYRRTGDFAAAQGYLQDVLARLPGKLAYMARKIIKLAEQGNSDLIAFENPG